LYGVASLDKFLTEIDTFSNPSATGMILTFYTMTMNGKLPHPNVRLFKNEATNGVSTKIKAVETNIIPRDHVSSYQYLLSVVLHKLRSIVHPLNVLMTLSSLNLASNTFHSRVHGELDMSAFHLIYAASSDHAHLHHNVSKPCHHL
jgi:hypothetical protein